RPRDRTRLTPAVLFKLALGLAQPPLTPLDARHDPLGIELMRAPASALLVDRRLPAPPAPGCPLPLEVARQPLPPTLLGLKLRRQLIPTRLPVALILGLIGSDRLRDDLPRDPVIVNVRVPAGV